MPSKSIGFQTFLSTTSVPIGEILLQSNKPMLKMWNVAISSGTRQFASHSHSRFEISICESGSGEYTTNNSTYEILPGDVFVFSANEPHCITKAGNDGLHITNLHFEPRCLLSENHNDIHENFISFCFSHSPDFDNRIPCEISLFLQNALTKIKEEFSHNDKNQSIAILSYLNLILVDLLRNHKYQTEVFPGDKDNFSYLLPVYDYIDTHLNEELSLNTLAAIAGFSPNYFSHIFKKLNGISLWDYITAKKIEKAVKMLLTKDSKFTMMDIALECGFNNTVNFNKAFKKQKGVTPSEFKKNPHLHFH